MNTTHLIFVALWGGIIAAESAMEILAKRDDTLAPAVTRIHYSIDIFLEGPLLVAIVISGVLLMTQVPLTGLLIVKVVCGLLAVIANGGCVYAVLRRMQALHDGSSEDVARYSRCIFLSALPGFPFGIAALVIGFMGT